VDFIRRYFRSVIGMMLMYLVVVLVAYIFINVNVKNILDLISKHKNNNTNLYLDYFFIFSCLFLFGFALVYYLLLEKKISIREEYNKKILYFFIAFGLAIRLVLSYLIPGYVDDIGCFKGWSDSLVKDFSRFYINPGSADYPPLYMYVLFIIGKLNAIPLVNKYYIILIKLPAILADIISACLVYKIGKKYLASELSLLIFILYMLNPSIIMNSSVWGQVESVFTLIIITALYFLAQDKLKLATVMFALSVLMKPQGIIFLPIMFFELVRRKKIRDFIVLISIALGVVLIVILPFNANRTPLWIIDLYKKTISEYPYATMNAFNIFYLLKANMVNNTKNLFVFSYHFYGMFFIIATTLFSWYIYIKGNNKKYAFLCAFIQIAGVFNLSVGMHERYLYAAVTFAVFTFIYIKDSRFVYLAIAFSFTSYVNCHFVLSGIGGDIIGKRLGEIISVINLILVIYLIIISLDNVNKIARNDRMI
jgi:Gpi18-like mannosyltransferase